MVRALRAFLSRQYFKRLWIYQELYLARKVDICSEDDHISMVLLDGLALLYSGDHWLPSGQYMIPRARHLLEAGVTSMAGVKKASPWDLLDQVDNMHLECRDIRDKLFGILAMLDWRYRQPIIADYNISGYEVAKEVLVRIPSDFPRQYDLWKHWADKVARIFEVEGRFSFSSHGTNWMFVKLSYERLSRRERRSYIIDLGINDAEPSSPTDGLNGVVEEYNWDSDEMETDED